MRYYGVDLYAESIKEMARRVVGVLGGGELAVKLLEETAAAETAAGRTEDTTLHAGMGLTQFDMVGFVDVLRRTRDHHKKAVYAAFGVDLDTLSHDELRHNPMLALIMSRLKYKLVPSPIPDTVEARAAYWKRYYNTAAGKGTVEHYINAVIDLQKSPS